MNFSLPPRPQYNSQQHFGRNVRRNPTWGVGSGYHAQDKIRYIHANYRFVVKPSGDYRAQAVDADVHLDWDNVLQILVSAQSQATNCPICLSKPVAPRMAKCGHIFCLPCLIRYMHSTDDTNPIPEKRARWKKCPICYDIIYISETRPVRWFVGQEGERPQEGTDVVLRLLIRRPGSTLALPRDGAEMLENTEEIPWYSAAEVMDYARIMKGSEDYMMEQYDEEVEELRQQEREDELMFGEDSQWTRKAFASIDEATRKIEGIGNPPSAPQVPRERKPRRPPIEYRTDTDEMPEHYVHQHAQRSGQSSSRGSVIAQYERSGSAVATETSRIPGARNQAAKIADGTSSSSAEALLHFYLSSLDIRILKAAFGDYPSFPTTILPRVEHVSTGHILDDELRKRAKYLGHLPHGCEVGFLACDWTDVVSPEILEHFGSEIERRRKRNNEKATREEKERLRAEKEEDDKRWATARRKRPSLSHDIHSGVEFQPLPDPSAADIHASSTSPPWVGSKGQQGSAFATLASPSTSPTTQRTVWGTRIAAPSTPPTAPIDGDDEVPGDDGWLQDWETQLLRDEELTAQIEGMRIETSNSTQVVASSGKKKKGKKITLMSTNARRGA
ncbi:uncharacterized protein KY384_000306 [Bacidia gigantensis]|uniref:uncharacterized protein n=1 Tax=Bacidia gigantensis TaxID=2732470 RepID=UPI001D03FA9B|nr:uncharacterized protein KY384_000306 [Bacidia gigantensis]KAG8526313.1 hypothetical protein KY384_000306 [Bacidia gigantensis]